jgi:hypothetical protein
VSVPVPKSRLDFLEGERIAADPVCTPFPTVSAKSLPQFLSQHCLRNEFQCEIAKLEQSTFNNSGIELEPQSFHPY